MEESGKITSISYKNPGDEYSWITGMVIGLIATLAIVVVAIMIVRACNSAPTIEKNSMLAKESRFPAYNKL